MLKTTTCLLLLDTRASARLNDSWYICDDFSHSLLAGLYHLLLVWGSSPTRITRLCMRRASWSYKMPSSISA